MGESTVDLEVVQYLSMTCSLAALFGMRDEAASLGDALMSVRPDDADANIVFASSLLCRDQVPDAIKVLQDKVLAADDQNDYAKVYLGLAKKMQGLTSEMDKLLDEVVAADRDPEAVKFANFIRR